jgi:multisubunit Na+/H+ antiporter MnhF subunit
VIGIAAALLAAFCALLAFWRFLLGPSLYDRALAVQALVFVMALASAGLGAAQGDAHWIDVSLALLLGLFVVDVALLKFIRVKTFQPPLHSPLGGRSEARR